MTHDCAIRSSNGGGGGAVRPEGADEGDLDVESSHVPLIETRQVPIDVRHMEEGGLEGKCSEAQGNGADLLLESSVGDNAEECKVFYQKPTCFFVSLWVGACACMYT